jgi:hypothetical protein
MVSGAAFLLPGMRAIEQPARTLGQEPLDPLPGAGRIPAGQRERRATA